MTPGGRRRSRSRRRQLRSARPQSPARPTPLKAQCPGVAALSAEFGDGPEMVAQLSLANWRRWSKGSRRGVIFADDTQIRQVKLGARCVVLTRLKVRLQVFVGRAFLLVGAAGITHHSFANARACKFPLLANLLVPGQRRRAMSVPSFKCGTIVDARGR
jgi:hypothetical protein